MYFILCVAYEKKLIEISFLNMYTDVVNMYA